MDAVPLLFVALVRLLVPAPSPVTEALPDAARAELVGCWRGPYERWTFQRHGDHGLDIVRVPDDAIDLDYLARAKLPRPVTYSSRDGSFAFGAAGSIHGLMMVFTEDRAHDLITAQVYASHDGAAYHGTGNTLTLARCAKGR